MRDFIRTHGFETYLPQEDGGLYSDLVKMELNEESLRERLFKTDYINIKKCSILLAILDGRVIDEGVCFELGAAYALGKHCMGFKTDSRSSIRGRDNLMIEGSLHSIARNWDELSVFLRGIAGD